MFWDKKRGLESLPDLPNDDTPPSMKDYHSHPPYEPDEEESKIHSLPVFPNSEKNEDFNQRMIKGAVENPEEQEDEDLPEMPLDEDEMREPPKMPRSPKVIELKEWTPAVTPDEPYIPKLPMPQDNSFEKPIYIKINKFREARESLEIVKLKLGEIDDLLATIKSVKIKEDQELSNWEKEIESIKSRIETVNSEIFDKNM